MTFGMTLTKVNLGFCPLQETNHDTSIVFAEAGFAWLCECSSGLQHSGQWRTTSATIAGTLVNQGQMENGIWF